MKFRYCIESICKKHLLLSSKYECMRFDISHVRSFTGSGIKLFKIQYTHFESASRTIHCISQPDQILVYFNLRSIYKTAVMNIIYVTTLSSRFSNSNSSDYKKFISSYNNNTLTASSSSLNNHQYLYKITTNPRKPEIQNTKKIM